MNEVRLQVKASSLEGVKMMSQKRGEVEPRVRPETIVLYVPAPSPRRRRGKHIVLAVIVIALV